MPRKRFFRSADFPYHITNRSNNREFFYVEGEALWRIFMKCLFELEIQFECEIHSFVLMSNHYHLLISTPNSNIGEAMKYLHREVARNANKEADRTNHFFGGRYKWSVITNENYYWNCVKYVFRNPVRAGLSPTVESYRHSSLNRKTELFSWKMTDFFQDRGKHIELNLPWLNEDITKQNENGIRLALRRREFRVPRDEQARAVEFDIPLYKKGTVTPG
jgi:putative transposase